jgi:N-acetylmuramoyl-L-alanine amidase
MDARVFLAAGHELGGGASANGLRESPYNLEVVRLAVDALRARDVEAFAVPPTTLPPAQELRAKIDWVNAHAAESDLAVDVHLDINDPGCAVFATEEPPELAAAGVLAAAITRSTGLRCRGGLPARSTFHKRLAFLSDTRCRALVAELCSMNTDDAAFAKRPDAQPRFAAGIADGCVAVLTVAGPPR